MNPSLPCRQISADASEHEFIWDANAHCWDEAVGSGGNSFYRHLVAPTALSLLALPSATSATLHSKRRTLNILELACGNGIFSNQLCAASPDVKILATDFSSSMLEIAKDRTAGVTRDQIAFKKLDVTDPEQLNELVGLSNHHGGFDRVVCNMALMDIESLDPLAEALPRLLGDTGRFVATVMHPSFNSSAGTQRHAHVVDNPVTGRGNTEYYIAVSRYLNISPTKGEAIAGQPELQYYFHRPLGDLLRPFLATGLVLDGLDEPAFQAPYKLAGQDLSWKNYTQIPPVLGFRLRKP